MRSRSHARAAVRASALDLAWARAFVIMSGAAAIALLLGTLAVRIG